MTKAEISKLQTQLKAPSAGRPETVKRRGESVINVICYRYRVEQTINRRQQRTGLINIFSNFLNYLLRLLLFFTLLKIMRNRQAKMSPYPPNATLHKCGGVATCISRVANEA